MFDLDVYSLAKLMGFGFHHSLSYVGKDILIQRRRLDIVISMRVLPFYLDSVPSTPVPLQKVLFTFWMMALPSLESLFNFRLSSVCVDNRMPHTHSLLSLIHDHEADTEKDQCYHHPRFIIGVL